MARQNQTPVPFNMSSRVDNVARRTSGKAGQVVLIDYMPVLRGDSVGGQVSVDLVLAHMPRRPLNAIVANVQAWFVPKSCHPQFSGYDEFMASYHGEQIKSLGASGTDTRNAPAYFNVLTSAARTAAINSDHYKTLGLTVPTGVDPNDDLFDAYTLVYNFRQRAHSSKIVRRDYFRESTAVGSTFAPAFWPENRFSRVVPDYERALVVGQLELDVTAGQLPLHDLFVDGSGALITTAAIDPHDPATMWNPLTGNYLAGIVEVDPNDNTLTLPYADMSGQGVTASLQDIDKARQTQAMAKMRASMAGQNVTGFDQENAILADLMSGLNVPSEMYNRPWLIGNRMASFSLAQRWAMDGASLQDSDTRGHVSVTLPINLPRSETGGVIIVTAEVVPERIYERQGDPWFAANAVSDLPDALRDVQRIEPVDTVPNWRVDASHTTPLGTYGYEPMNDRWNREFTCLGGDYLQPSAGSPTPSPARDAIWTAEIVDPAYNSGHFIVPDPFPHTIFSVTNGSAFDAIVRRASVVRGLTQIGDILSEDNSDFSETEA